MDARLAQHPAHYVSGYACSDFESEKIVDVGLVLAVPACAVAEAVS
jgi:hypothetical protein